MRETRKYVQYCLASNIQDPSVLTADQKWRELYEPLYPPFATDICVKKDEVYGPAERNRLDVYLPKANAQNRAVLIYVHGGGFFSGDKSWSEKVRASIH
jgi:prenylcysteine alpha-carboxyl methylesterase